jgi:CDP-L-myo-inositol myo-inositolphosphotransferase
LWSAGLRTFTVVTEHEDAFTAAQRELARVAPDAQIVRVAHAHDDPFADRTSRVVTVSCDGVFHGAMVKRLLVRGRLANLGITLPGADGIHVWSAADYARRGDGEPASGDVLLGRTGDFFPIGTPGDVIAAEKGIFSWSIKETDGVVSRTFNRPVSTWISRRIAPYDIRPSHLTALTAMLALATFSFLILGSAMGLVVGCVLYHITSVADGLDGEIARAKFMSTPRGAALDTAVDMGTNLLFMIGISLGTSRVYDPDYLWGGMYIGGTASAAIVIMALILKFGPGGGSFDVLGLTIRRRLAARPRLAQAFTRANSLFKRDFFALGFAVLAVTGFTYAIPWVLAFGTTAWLLAVLVNAPAMMRANPAEVLPAHITGPEKP